MEGPTPVSALDPCRDDGRGRCLHAGAGRFLIQAVAASALHVIAWIGSITAVLAALIATQQNDIKRILAYSTLSQLGYMVMAVGLASGEAAMFHLFTHAFFKALLFLGAGSIILDAASRAGHLEDGRAGRQTAESPSSLSSSARSR